MPDDLRADIHITRAELIRKLYHEAGANTFIASQTNLIFKHAQSPYIRKLLRSIFDKFIDEEILDYTAANSMSINFVGSIAFLFQDVLAEALRDKGLVMGKIINKPIEALTIYHHMNG